MDRQVGFNITPTVHIYKKVPVVVQMQEQEQLQQQLQQGELQLQQEQLQEQQLQQQMHEAAPEPLKIGIPKVYMEEAWEKPPAYDKSPMSPRTHQEIRYLRAQEQNSRTSALTNAIIDFTNKITPESITGVSPSQRPMMSPLSLN